MRALTLGELILVNILRERERMTPDQVRKSIFMARHKPPPIPARTYPKMPRVGFAGLKAYHVAAKGELDNRADQLADRIDKIKNRGLGAIGHHDKNLDALETEIDEMDAMVREGSNGGPLPG